MQRAHEIFNLLRVQDSAASEPALRKAWLGAQQTPCKDVVALALPLKPVPTTLESFKQALLENGKGNDFLISSWYVVYVGCADGNEWGWSKVPYDSKKRLPASELKPLYSGEEGETRFWSFKKVSNNMNKGARVDEEGEDLSFVLPKGACFSVFLREDSYDGSRPFFAAEGSGTLEAYTPVMLQLSSTNHEQAGKGNGLKLRRVVPLARTVLSTFRDEFFASKMELEQAQARAAAIKALSATAKHMSGCPVLCRVSHTAFAFHDAEVVELIESGVDPELGSKLLIPVAMLLEAMHSADVSRALRMLNVALGHGAVSCLVVASKTSEAATVVHLHVDLAEAMWLHTLQKSKVVDFPTELPVTSMLAMCLGPSVAAGAAGFGSDVATHLQWYCPRKQVQVATPDGREVLNYVVFEMELAPRQTAGLREEPEKVLFMDEVAGMHHLVKVYYAEKVTYEAGGLVCENPRMLVTWQLRPGLGAEVLGGHLVARKRQYLAADEQDLMNCGGTPKKARTGGGGEGGEGGEGGKGSKGGKGAKGAKGGGAEDLLPDMLSG